MTTAVTHHEQRNTTEATLFLAFELREKTWKLGFTTGHGHKPRERTVTARHQERVLDDIAQATRRLGLPDTAPVVSCYEAGREGFWLHRFLQGQGVTFHVIWVHAHFTWSHEIHHNRTAIEPSSEPHQIGSNLLSRACRKTTKHYTL
jgi:hypothetical protein